MELFWWIFINGACVCWCKYFINNSGVAIKKIKLDVLFLLIEKSKKAYFSAKSFSKKKKKKASPLVYLAIWLKEYFKSFWKSFKTAFHISEFSYGALNIIISLSAVIIMIVKDIKLQKENSDFNFFLKRLLELLHRRVYVCQNFNLTCTFQPGTFVFI